MLLDRDAILSAEPTLPHVDVEVPEWGGTIRLRSMTAGERDRWEADQLASPNADVRARLVAACACDDSGAPLFAKADVARLSAQSARVMGRLFDAALALNRISGEDVDALEKNSSNGHSAG
jgi:hypothetical protein